jgi:hypothetical protein
MALASACIPSASSLKVDVALTSGVLIFYCFLVDYFGRE